MRNDHPIRHLVWFRTDLRVHDNPALHHAMRAASNADESASVLALYFVTPRQWQQHGLGQRKIRLIQNAVHNLKQSLARLGVELLVLQADTFSHSLQQLQQLVTELDIRHVSFNNEYEVNESNRDRHWERWARQHQISVHRFHDQCLIPPGDLATKSGSPFKVYSPFRKAWLARAEGAQLTPLPCPDALPTHTRPSLSLRHGLVDTDCSPDALWFDDEASAHDALEDFLQQQGRLYHQQRDLPALDATSQLSVALALGLLSPRQCLFAASQMNNGLLAGGQAGLDSWINELTWREFYRHLLVAFPRLCQHKAFKADTEQLPWRDAEADFQAWCEGRTGYPLVDAAQKQLLASGWMHNRLRMVSAMFLTKHLLIDWRRGEAFFNRHLVDADFASNNGGWQWSASTGADGVPYFRIFNPTTQSQRFDASGQFLVRYLPELAALPAARRHQPNTLERQQCGYPAAIVDHAFARQRALQAFKSLKIMQTEME
ncbi:deoxyribodipyrimidine photo-lyase [Oceanobacter sp. 3_MG-2023]|jgi:deoxyribodipyrimidine photo-lyase|uniref:deoxyribodipyrimidine photo-lyase n=1 Tax=Oceanobacter sp. 3_MG-2023 TaxID=3062622 RepID=UPI0027343FA0|nr:deoxyribodipyrimidine photo-lyase [Oceanobacter sp. 3_MG-2023]MDP2505765.1 deoxyribodipyrimidine photo-lyase [Oceanobacter sp. 3_MG-2023]